MKYSRHFLASFIVLFATFAGPEPGAAQPRPAPADRTQIRKSIEIVEGVLNTVRQQALASTAASSYKGPDSNNPVFVYLKSAEGNRSEGIYLEGYGVIFEVPLPNFSEQRSFNLVFKNSLPRISVGKTPRTPSTVQAPYASTANVVMEANAEIPTTALNTLSKLIDSYVRESQDKNKESALRGLIAKLRESNIFSQTSLFEPLSLWEVEKSQPEGEQPKPDVLEKRLQESVMKAIADYGNAIPGLRPNEFVTILFKAPVPRDFSLFSPETRTSKIVRFTVRDLQEYKVGKISYEELQARAMVEEN